MSTKKPPGWFKQSFSITLAGTIWKQPRAPAAQTQNTTLSSLSSLRSNAATGNFKDALLETTANICTTGQELAFATPTKREKDKRSAPKLFLQTLSLSLPPHQQQLLRGVLRVHSVVKKATISTRVQNSQSITGTMTEILTLILSILFLRQAQQARHSLRHLQNKCNQQPLDGSQPSLHS